MAIHTTMLYNLNKLGGDAVATAKCCDKMNNLFLPTSYPIHSYVDDYDSTLHYSSHFERWPTQQLRGWPWNNFLLIFLVSLIGYKENIVAFNVSKEILHLSIHYNLSHNFNSSSNLSLTLFGFPFLIIFLENVTLSLSRQTSKRLSVLRHFRKYFSQLKLLILYKGLCSPLYGVYFIYLMWFNTQYS